MKCIVISPYALGTDAANQALERDAAKSAAPPQLPRSAARHVTDMRATICVDVSHDEECAAIDAWFERWEERLSFVSDNEGTAAVVSTWNGEGPDEAILEIPPNARAASEWAGIS